MSNLAYLQPPTIMPVPSPVPSTVLMTGHELHIRTRRLSPRAKALYARRLVDGAVAVERLTVGQASTLVDVSRSYITAAGAKPSRPKLVPKHTGDDLVEVVRRAGVERTWQAICDILSADGGAR